jgi:hypothetical protein
MSETFCIIDIEHRLHGRYYLVVEQWSVEHHKVLRRKDLTTSYVTYSQAHRARAAAYEMWALYEEWRDAQD